VMVLDEDERVLGPTGPMRVDRVEWRTPDTGGGVALGLGPTVTVDPGPGLAPIRWGKC